MSDQFKEIKKIIVDQLGVEENKVVPEAKFIDDLGADSLDIVELIMAVEEKFQIEISEAEAENIQTVQTVMDYLEKNAG